MTCRFFTLLTLTYCCILLPLPASSSSKEDKLKDIKHQIKAIQHILAKQGRDESASEKELKRLEKTLAQTQRNLTKQNAEIKRNARKLTSLQIESTTLQETLALQQSYLKQQLRSAYLIGQQEQLQLLLNQHDTTSVSRMLTYYQYLNKARAEEIDSVKGNLEKLSILRNSISKKKQLLQEQRNKRIQDVAVLSAQRKEHENFLLTLRTRMLNQQSQLSSLEKNKRQITTLINSLETVIDDIPAKPPTPTVFSRQKGKLPWPIRGKVKHTFGSLRAGQDLRWQGVFISSPAGKSVNAVASGRIVFADWLAGFGLITIIDHQDNYMSLYAHNSVLFTEIGDWVNANQLIGKTGQTGGIQQAGLYFEIREHGQAINPDNWLAKR